MKKGCFFTTVVIFTILVGSGIYLVKNHRELVIRWFKPLIVNNVRRQTEKDIDKIKDPQYKDTLKALVSRYAEFVKTNDRYDVDRGQDFMDELRYIIHRKKIDSTDIRQLTDFLNKEKLTYERSEKNGN